MDNGSPRGSIFGDSSGFHGDNMGGVYIKSTDDMVYFDGEVDFSNATISRLKISAVEGVQNKLNSLQNEIGEIRGDLFNGLSINAII
ncbi:hypothetical protein [Paenibacillus polymyxa]|uniref:hypothetical protein n=1 Tax=Paenibacillus polymyxa TaxID=1406 RepID=UPI00046FE67F|nr:hypothetical protein [Paenibacillus polymyxa]